MIKKLLNHFRNKNKIAGLIDKTNAELYYSLIKTQNIHINFGKFECYGVYSVRDKHIIDVQSDNICFASFSHELLHIYLRSKGVHAGGRLSLMTLSDEKLHTIFNEDLVDHVSNCLDHFKMLPLYLKLGYSIDSFIADFHISKSNAVELNNIQEYFTTNFANQKVFLAQAIEKYIATFIAMKACPNPSFNYQSTYLKLRRIDYNLYDILDKFIESWNNYDYTQSNQNYGVVISQYIENFKSWLAGKTILSIDRFNNATIIE